MQGGAWGGTWKMGGRPLRPTWMNFFLMTTSICLDLVLGGSGTFTFTSCSVCTQQYASVVPPLPELGAAVAAPWIHPLHLSCH